MINCILLDINADDDVIKPMTTISTTNGFHDVEVDENKPDKSVENDRITPASNQHAGNPSSGTAVYVKNIFLYLDH